MNNYIGLESDRWYKIINVADNTVVHVHGSKVLCLPEDDEKQDLQRFQALMQDEGHFRLAARYQKNAGFVQVWDYLPHRSLPVLIQKKQSVSEISNQFWRSELVPGAQCMYLLESVQHPERCLKNMNSEDKGTGQQIRVVRKADEIGSPYAHWRLEPEPLA